MARSGTCPNCSSRGRAGWPVPHTVSAPSRPSSARSGETLDAADAVLRLVGAPPAFEEQRVEGAAQPDEPARVPAGDREVQGEGEAVRGGAERGRVGAVA